MGVDPQPRRADGRQKDWDGSDLGLLLGAFHLDAKEGNRHHALADPEETGRMGDVRNPFRNFMNTPSSPVDFWNQRYREPGWAYGTEPNEFLAAEAGRIPFGDVLCLGEGEGRNAVYLAGQRYCAFAVDQSEVALTKAQRLASERGLTIQTQVVDLETFDMGRNRWQGITSIFVHLPAELRRDVHRRAVEALVPGGVILLEAYAPGQEKLGTGGPKEPSLLYALDDVLHDFADIEPLFAKLVTRTIHEGRHHNGSGVVVQFLGRKGS